MTIAGSITGRWVRASFLGRTKVWPRLHGLGRLRVHTVVHMMANVSFEWDPAKARANAQKHRIELADAVAVFDDGSAVTIPDEDSEDEERWVTIGRDAFDRILVVVYTWRGTNIRLISAWKASRREQRDYEG